MTLAGSQTQHTTTNNHHHSEENFSNMEISDSIYKSILELSPFPVFLCTGENMIISVANEATLSAWGKDKTVIGRPFNEALPELHNQPFLQI